MVGMGPEWSGWIRSGGEESFSRSAGSRLDPILFLVTLDADAPNLVSANLGDNAQPPGPAGMARYSNPTARGAGVIIDVPPHSPLSG